MRDDASFIDLLVDFGQELRQADVVIGSGEITTYCTAVAALNPSDILDLYWAGRSTLITRRDQIAIYNDVFRQFFLDVPAASEDPRITAIKTASGTMSVLQVPLSEPQDGESEEQEAKLGLMSSTSEVWRNKSFAVCTPEELSSLRRIMAQVRLTPPRRQSRRSLSSRKGSRFNVRQTVRESMRMHGEPAGLFWLERKRKIRPLVFILDVSGSMSDYSRNLLQFAYCAKRAADHVEVFCFGTRLTRITRSLDRRRPDDAINLAAKTVFDWDGGTRIGDSLHSFVRDYGRRGTSRGAIVVICSDGLDRGDPAVLSNAMERLSRLCHRIIWMNPHKGDDSNYQPNSLGMMVAAPHIDLIVSGHNLRSLEEFAAMLPELRYEQIMKWSVSVVAEGDREMTLDEIVALADAVATMSGIASGYGSMSYGAQMVIEAISADAAVEIAVPAFIQAAATANLPSWPITRAEVIGEEQDMLDEE